MTGLTPNCETELVWNKGIAALCDRRIPDEFSGGEYGTNPNLAGAMASSRLPDDLIANPKMYQGIDREVIWVRVSWLKSFVKQVLPFVTGRFVLATGDSDSCVPWELPQEAKAILNSHKVIHWFTQNYDGSAGADKISPLPIGIDFHVQAEKTAWGEPRANPADQERQLKRVAAILPPLRDRIPEVYVDFAWQKSWGLRHYRRFHPLRGTTFHETRRKTAQQVRNKSHIFCQAAALPRSEMWRQRGRYAFVLSPHGMGLDCHRTWEALALGHIVLVPSSSLDSMYSGLPVVCLKSWGEITPENLAKWLELYATGDHKNNPKLTSRFWVEHMRSVLPLHSELREDTRN